MYLAIDKRLLIRQPHTIEIVPGQHEVSVTADGRPMVRPGSPYCVLNCTWGEAFSYQDVLNELHRLRANRGVHSVTFEPLKGGRYLTINAYMGTPAEAHVRRDVRGKLVAAAFTVPFVQVDMPTFLFPLRWRLPGIIAIVSPMASHLAPAAGRIIQVDGWIQDLGAGAGQTRVQISNGATNYLSTPGDFVCAPPNRQLQNQVLAANTDFAQDDWLDIDVTDIPAGGMSANAVITAWCWVFRP